MTTHDEISFQAYALKLPANMPFLTLTWSVCLTKQDKQVRDCRLHVLRQVWQHGLQRGEDVCINSAVSADGSTHSGQIMLQLVSATRQRERNDSEEIGHGRITRAVNLRFWRGVFLMVFIVNPHDVTPC
jgi:hypothetical protein